MATEKPTAIKAKDPAIKALKPLPTEYEVAVGDDGLRLRVTPTGKKVFRWRYRKVQLKNGKPQWGVKTLGEYSRTFGLAAAQGKLRDAKKAHKAALESGFDETHISTVKELAEEFYKRRLEPHRKNPSDGKRTLDKESWP